MDPVTLVGLVSSAVTLATICGSAAKDLHTLASKYKNAKLAILSMAQGLDTMQLAWSKISIWAQYQTPDGLLEEDDFIGRLRRSLETGSLVLDALKEELLIYKPLKMGFAQRTKAVWNEGALRSHQERIRDQASSMTLLLQAINLPTLRDRNDLLRGSEKQFKMSDESAYSIVPSDMSTSIYTGRTTDSGVSKGEEDLVYKPLTFENELFTARVYKRNYASPAFWRLYKELKQKTSDQTRHPIVAQETAEDPDGSIAEILTIREPGHTHRWYNKTQLEFGKQGIELGARGPEKGKQGLELAQQGIDLTKHGLECGNQGLEIVQELEMGIQVLANMIPTKGQSARDEDTSREINTWPNAESRISFAEACEQGKVEIVQTMLESGEKVDDPVLGKDHSLRDLSPIHFASRGGHIQVVEILMSYGADKEMPSCVRGERPLHLAVQAGHLAMVRYFLDNGTDIAAPDGEGAQAIHLAVKRGSAAILSLLLDCGAAIDSAMKDGAQPLHVASKIPDRVYVIKFLCGQGANIEAETQYGGTPLYYACRYNAPDNMKALLELGAAHSPQGLSILDIALKRGYLQATRLLLQDGLDPNRPISGRPSALHALTLDYFCTPEHLEIGELLLAYGADGDLQDSNGDTPLHCLCSRSAIEIGLQIQLANILLRSMRDVDTINFAGRTALGVSVENESNERLVWALFKSGARLLRKSQGVEIGLDVGRSTNERLPPVTCYLRRGSNTFTKRFGFLTEKGQFYRLSVFPLIDLRRLLSNPESSELENGSWVRYDGTTPISHRERTSLPRTSSEDASSLRYLDHETGEIAEPCLRQSHETLERKEES